MNNAFVLVINSGSSSLKFAVIDSNSGDAVLSGLGESFGLAKAQMSWKYQGNKTKIALQESGNRHQQAIDKLVELVRELGLIEDIIAIGHRIVHGGETFTHTVAINEDVIKEIESVKNLAPLHAPANVLGIKAAMAAFPHLSQFAVFDTAFHQTMPAKAYSYAISQKLYREHGIRRYGFHGSSHYFVSREAAKMLDKPAEECSFITIHLGNGASACAIKDGKSVDTSMGFTPLAGLMMGTRCGDLDPSIPEFLANKGFSQKQIHNELNGNAGFLGVSELTSDCRGIVDAANEGHAGAKLALELFAYRVAKYIGAYMVALDRLDGIVFTGGIGENSSSARSAILESLKIFGYQEDTQGNEQARFGNAGIISKAETPLAMVIPTNEEWVIAKESMALLHA